MISKPEYDLSDWSNVGTDILILILEKDNSFHVTVQNNSGTINVKKDVSALEEKSTFKIMGLSFLF